jgi:hypothetical protein
VSILQGQKWILLARIHLSKWRSDDLSYVQRRKKQASCWILQIHIRLCLALAFLFFSLELPEHHQWFRADM